MLEARSAYGYYGAAGGVTGETPPSGVGCVEVNMPYRDYKSRYPECKTLGDYDKIRKTITVLVPEEYTERPNFGNRYGFHYFRFTFEPHFKFEDGTIEFKAKNYKNALRNAKKWAKESGRTITGDAPGHEQQRNYQ